MRTAAKIRRLAWMVALLAPLVVAATPARAEVRAASGYLIDAAGLLPGVTTDTFDIRLDGLTNESDLVGYAALAQKRGASALHDQLSSKELGRFRVGRDLGLPIALAQEATEDGLRRLLLVIERPISYRELRNGGRALEYPYLVIELRFDADGQGDGALYPLSKLRVSPDGKVSYESWSPQPVRLTRVDVS